MKKFVIIIFLYMSLISAWAQNSSNISEEEAIERAIIALHADSRKPASWIPDITSNRISARFKDNEWFIVFWGESDKSEGGVEGDHMLVILEANGKLNHIWHGM